MISKDYGRFCRISGIPDIAESLNDFLEFEWFRRLLEISAIPVIPESFKYISWGSISMSSREFSSNNMKPVHHAFFMKQNFRYPGDSERFPGNRGIFWRFLWFCKDSKDSEIFPGILGIFQDFWDFIKIHEIFCYFRNNWRFLWFYKILKISKDFQGFKRFLGFCRFWEISEIQWDFWDLYGFLGILQISEIPTDFLESERFSSFQKFLEIPVAYAGVILRSPFFQMMCIDIL